jgi:RNA polymerase sigma-70 factor (ECF subfamily)
MSGDRLASLYRVYGPAIYSRCHRLLGDRAAAEDATQETFMRVQRHLDKAPTSREALIWIYRIATNYCLNEIRNVKTRATPMEVLPEEAGVDAEGSLADRDLAARLIDRAPEKLRAVAWLHYVDGVDQGQVAVILGISRRTVLNRLGEFVRRARVFAQRVEV